MKPEPSPDAMSKSAHAWRADVAPGSPLTAAGAVVAAEFRLLEGFSENVWFDHAALALASSADEAWALAGSDWCLNNLLQYEQTVLQGPHTDVLTDGLAISVGSTDDAVARWPVLAGSGVLAAAQDQSLLVMPLSDSAAALPIGTVCFGRISSVPFAACEASAAAEVSRSVLGILLRRWSEVRDVDRLDSLLRDQRHVAAGVLASFLGVRVSQALAIMRARAFADGTTLAEFAEGVLRVLGPRSDASTPGAPRRVLRP